MDKKIFGEKNMSEKKNTGSKTVFGVPKDEFPFGMRCLNI